MVRAAIANAVPLAGSAPGAIAAGDAAGSSTIRVERHLVSAGFFSTLGLPLGRGRDLEEHDDAMIRRAREIRLRIALGAGRRDVVSLGATQLFWLVGLGALGGVFSTFLLTRLAQGLGGVFDAPGWLAFAGPVAILVLIGLCAALVPVRRALRLDPAVVLRQP